MTSTGFFFFFYSHRICAVSVLFFLLDPLFFNFVMSFAEFVRNPDVNTAVYRWEATGVDELTRQNKLTSLPFWIPNATSRRHQFKLVLLRGLVPSTDPNNDSFGLIVELIPPPPEAAYAATSTASSSSAPCSFPGGCVVTCEVLPLDALDDRRPPQSEAKQLQQQCSTHDKPLTSTKTAVVDASNTQISFPDLIPADINKNPRFVSGTPKSLTLQITIETGVNVPLHQVATTAYSFFSSLSSSVSQLLGTTTHLVHEGRENLSAILSQAAAATAPAAAAATAATNAVAAAGHLTSSAGGAGEESGTAGGAATAMPPLWELPPEEWRSRPEAWRLLLCERLAALDGTYRHGVEKTLSSEEVALLTEVGLSETDLWSLYGLFDFDRDVQESLLSAPVVCARRYALVPAKLKEETFWANFFWKAHCVGQCVTDRQVSAVIAALCTPARVVDSTDLSVPLEEVLRHISDATEINAVMWDFIERREAGEPWCIVVAETARHCVAALQVASAERTDLSPHTTQQLTKALQELKATLSMYGAALSTPPSTPAVVPTSPPLAEDEEQGVRGKSAGVPAAAGTAEEAVSAALPVEELAPSLAEQPGVAATPAAVSMEVLEGDAVQKAEVQDERQRKSTNSAGLLVSTGAASPSPLPSPSSPTSTRADTARSASRIEFAKMPWEEEDSS